MTNLQRCFLFVIGLNSLVSSGMSLTATRTIIHITNVSSMIFGEQATLVCGFNSAENQTGSLTVSRLLKSEEETIARWDRARTEIFPKGRNWTVMFDNNTGELKLDMFDLKYSDSGIYRCSAVYNNFSEETWLNLTRSDQYESEAKTTHYDVIGSVPSKIGISISFGIVGIVVLSSGLIFAYYKRKVWLPKLAPKNKRTLTSSEEELQQSQTIPYLHSCISECILVVESSGLDTEGIYRLSCPQWELTKARQDIRRDVNAVRRLPVITVCNLLKILVRELATPLIPEDIVQELLMANALITESEKSTRMKALLQQLDSSHFNCLTSLIFHLRRVAENTEINKMTAENLAIIFAPSLLQTSLSYKNLEPIDAIKSAREENDLKSQVIALLIKAL